MDDLTKRYQLLSIGLQGIQRLIRDLEYYEKRVPEYCPAHKKIVQDLEGARSVRTEIKEAINHIADHEMRYELNFPPRSL